MKIDGIHAESEDGISYVHHILCEKCQNSIEVPIKQSDKDTAIGGIFRIVVIHQCIEEQIALMLYFDDNFALRQKVSCPVTLVEPNNIDLLDKNQHIDRRQHNAFIYLYKKLGTEQLAKIIFGAIIGQQIVFLGEKLEVEPTCLAMSTFTFHRKCHIDCWSFDKSSASIIGTSPNNSQIYKDSLIVNLPKNYVQNGIVNEYIVSFTEDLVKIEEREEYYKTINEEIKTVLSYCSDFSTIDNVDEAEDYLSALVVNENIDKALLELILAITSQMNPHISIFYRRFIDNIEDSLETSIAVICLDIPKNN